MNKAYIFVLGGSSTILLSAFIFVVVPLLQASAVRNKGVSAQQPYTELQKKGRAAYIEYGCVYCHSQQVRDPVAGADREFGWGRPSLPSDYIYDKPHLLGTMRTGPDLSNIGSRQPSKDWHHLHLYDPRLLVRWSIMPGFPFLYKKITAVESPASNAVRLPSQKNTWIIPSQKAEALIDYLNSLKRDKEPKPAEAQNE